MRSFYVVVLTIFSSMAVAEVPGVMSGDLSIEYRHFDHEGAYQNDNRSQASVALSPRYVYAWGNDRNVITFEPFWRLDSLDHQRSHADIRELAYVSSWDYVDVRLGISKVFWGVTESQHLVDVINQTDGIENPDGEQKLGQPMVNITAVTRFGDVGAFILPYFRERTFAGKDGRFRVRWEIDTSDARYTHPRRQRHVDYALRWRGDWQDLDWGFSWFKGTDREPTLLLNKETGKLVPVYGQSRQVGLELQHIYMDLLSKAEFLYKETELQEAHFASTVGLEHTLYGVRGGADVGLLYEWLYDTRGDATPSGLGNASFLGARLALNDVASTDALLGVTVDHDMTRLSAFRLEASRRLNDHFSADLQVNVIVSPPGQSILREVEKDSYVQLTVRAFF